MTEEISCSIVIPVYNTRESLIELHSRLTGVFSGYSGKYEIIFVNDGSPDPETGKILKSIAMADSKVRVISFIRNFGQHAATLCGFKEAVGDYVITLDDDLQHAPEDIPLLLEKRNHDLVIASFTKTEKSFKQKVLSKVKSKLDELLINKPKHIELTSFRLLKRHIAKAITKFYTPYPYLPTLLLFCTRDIVNVKVNQQARKEGYSGYSTKKIIKIFVNLLFNNSTFLLRGMAISGFGFAIICLLISLYFLAKKIIYGIPVEGWTSLIVAILGVGSILIGGLGVTGEYLTRIVAGIEKRPAYIVKETIEPDE